MLRELRAELSQSEKLLFFEFCFYFHQYRLKADKLREIGVGRLWEKSLKNRRAGLVIIVFRWNKTVGEWKKVAQKEKLRKNSGQKMGNCLKTEASDDESLLGDSDEGERQSRRNRRNRRRTRVQGYMANNAPSIPDPTHYFNLGMSWQFSYRKHSFIIHKTLEVNFGFTLDFGSNRR